MRRGKKGIGAVSAIALTAMSCLLPAQAQNNFPTGTGDHLLQGMMGMAGQFARQFQDSQMGQQMDRTRGNSSDLSGGGRQATQNNGNASGGVTLDGAWRGAEGEYLLIDGQRFRLHSDTRRYIDGRLQVRDDLVAFYYPRQRAALVYRYSGSSEQLQLQDSQGRILRYQRVPRR